MTVLIVMIRLFLRISHYIILVESFSPILAACATVGILLWPCCTAVCGRACRLPHSLHHDLRRCRPARRHPVRTMLRPRRPPRRAVRCTLCCVSHNDVCLPPLGRLAGHSAVCQCCLRCMGSDAARGPTRSSGNRCCASTSTGTRRTVRNRQHHALPHAGAHACICTRWVVRCADLRAFGR